MSSPNIQLVKWTFPALALIVGFFWYKHRRVDRGDPGGLDNSKNVTDNNSTVVAKDSKANLNLHDSGINIDENSTVNTSNQSANESIDRPRRVTDNLDIPTRRSVSQPISIASRRSVDQSLLTTPWHNVRDEPFELNGVVLSSNPTSASSDMRLTIPMALTGANCDNFANNDSTDLTNSNEEINVTDSGTNETTMYNVNHISGMTECSSIENALIVKQNENGIISERDSANHSPVSAVMDESGADEVRSVGGSTDSGKGGSINGHAQNNSLKTYEFAVPQLLVGKLIGKRGISLQQINHKASVRIVIRDHPVLRDDKLCLIEGYPAGITAALKLIRQKFPENKFPHFTLEQISWPESEEMLSTMPCKLDSLSLVNNVSNDISVCHIVTPNHLFLRLPLHPTYPALISLDRDMTELYNTTEAPLVSDDLEKGNLVVVKWGTTWARGCVEVPDPIGESHLVRLLDHGGYWYFSTACMRQMCCNYISLPAQAIEVYLANVQPKGGEWVQEAYDVVHSLCMDSIGLAHVDSYIDNNVYVNLYMNYQNEGIISVADELLVRGFADPVVLEDIVPQTVLMS